MITALYFFATFPSASVLGPGIVSATLKNRWSSNWQKYCERNSSCVQMICAPFFPASSARRTWFLRFSAGLSLHAICVRPTRTTRPRFESPREFACRFIGVFFGIFFGVFFFMTSSKRRADGDVHYKPPTVNNPMRLFPALASPLPRRPLLCPLWRLGPRDREQEALHVLRHFPKPSLAAVVYVGQQVDEPRYALPADGAARLLKFGQLVPLVAPGVLERPRRRDVPAHIFKPHRQPGNRAVLAAWVCLHQVAPTLHRLGPASRGQFPGQFPHFLLALKRNRFAYILNISPPVRLQGELR